MISSEIDSPNKDNLPIIGITMGDPSGIGPEIVLKAVRDPSVWRYCRPVIIGRPGVFLSHAQLLGMTDVHLVPVEEAGGWENLSHERRFYIASTCPIEETDRTRLGAPNALGGRAAYEAIKLATELALDGKIAAMATAPLNKMALKMAGINYPGHTEMIADLCGSDDAFMLFIGGGLRVVLATIHCALNEVTTLLTTERLLRVFEATHEMFRGMLGSEMRIVACGVNPHASEDGLFGDEEARIIAPAIQQARARGINVTGPLPGDTVFARQLRGDFDIVVAMYHDQGLAAIKTIAFDSSVNITMGLPVIRTSVDHGTAYDIVGKNKANHQSMVEAILMAVKIAESRA